VTFVGYRADVAAWYRALDVAVIASEREGLARSMIESLAAGTPVVSFDVCSAREILEGHRCGLVVPHGDYAALAERIGTLLHNPSLREALGTTGAAAARTLFDPADVVRGYEAVYARVGDTVAAGRQVFVP
jgi:glycosyltransferase involved in cell wall biosynthesis